MRGFFGKLPARGDFVSAGLPRDFVARWDSWICGVLSGALASAGECWLQAPVWRFNLAPGVCGVGAAAGLLLPSIDQVGRRFPLVLAWFGEALDADAAQAVARSAITQGLPPAVLAEHLAAVPLAGTELTQCPEFGGLWWNEATGLQHLPALPDATSFATMIAGDVDG